MIEGPLEYDATSGPAPPIEAEVFDALRQCFDLCCREKGISVVDMGLIESVAVAGGDVRIDMVLTSGWCPFAMHLLTDMEQQVAALDGVETADVNIVWGPTWTPERLSPDARRKLSLPLERLLPLRNVRLARATNDRRPTTNDPQL